MLELIEGETLAERLYGGALPVAGALKLALQHAEALEEAHEKGVVHRDLKPANIKITSNGKIEVHDLGLAKALARDGHSAQTATVHRHAVTARSSTCWSRQVRCECSERPLNGGG